MPKKTYQELLKENLAEFDTTKTVDVKGPMLDPILGYEGDGELPTYKDAASVLERYYFGEKRKEHEITEMDYENDKGDSSGKNMKHTEGPEGEEQAGTSNANNPKGSEDEKEKDIAKEGAEIAEKEMNTADLKSSNMKDTDGPEGEEQAGTGDTYTDFKKRVVEAIESIVEQEDEEEEDEKEEEKEEEKEDEKEEEGEKEEMKEADSAVPGGPSPKKKGEDYEEDEGQYSKVKESDETITLEADEEDITEALENEIIEKLIAEMEQEAVTEQEEEGEKKEEEGEEKEAEGEAEEEEGEEEEGLDVDKKMEEMVNRLTQGHTEGPEGEEQAGTGGDEKVIPPRKDRSNEGTGEKGTKPMTKDELADA